jgi:hypothetical protein
MVVGRCALCLRDRELRESHLLPRAIYRDLRSPHLPNPNPIVGTPDETGPRQEQIKEYLLCAECEDRFNQRGEKWILENGYRLKGPSPIYEMMRAASALREYPAGTTYAGAEISGLDMDKITYFGASVFWRAALPVWTVQGKRDAMIHLGSYREELREFLLDDSEFPHNMVLLTAVARRPDPPPVMGFPTGERKKEGYHQHTFEIPGQHFMLMVGRQIPQRERDRCAIRSSRRVIYFTPYEEITSRNTAKLFGESSPSPSLRKLHRKTSGEELP